MAKELAKIQKMIYEIRGYKVMLDSDLAGLYGVPTHRLNEAVKRNSKRFPSEFMFKLTDDEWKYLRSQNAIFSKDARKYKPYVFTEHGILMLSSVLNSDIAIETNIQIMQIFVKTRQHVGSYLSTDERIEELRKLLMLHIDACDSKFIDYDETIQNILQILNNLTEKPLENKRIGFYTGN